MKTLIQEFQVSYRYAVHFTRGLLDPANPLLRDTIAREGERPKLLFVLDEGLLGPFPSLVQDAEAYCAAHADDLDLAGLPLLVPGGEDVKRDPRHYQAVLDAIDDRGIDRHSYVVAVGGGAVLDAVGYAAAIAHRGVRLVRVPTTVLSQNDSGVGVKNSVNAFAKKNFLGTFAPPAAVLNDEDFLAALPRREWVAGISEAVKVALIKDAAFFGRLERDAPALAGRDMGAMRHLVQRCAELHLQHIASGDPFEMGSARPLDFGHWAAHKLEFLSGYALRHGEAVAIGIALDSVYSQLRGYLSAAEVERILALIEAVGLPAWAPDLGREDEVLAGLEEFREHLGGPLTITLLRGIGSGFEVNDMDEGTVREAIGVLRARAGRHERQLLTAAD
ncbi:MAG TPA: 3-dehydroquinate synthase [Deinococcales bacterium]|nr:3-dehydroquinate synthase [Deinococcales bacterium]